MISINDYISHHEKSAFYYVDDIPDKNLVLFSKKTFNESTGKKSLSKK